MRQFHTAVIERRERFDGDFATQPHEVAWASEAIWFVRVEGVDGAGSLKLHVQVSVDGTRWLDEGSAFDDLTAEGDRFLRVTHFGGWLRLRGEIEGDAAFTLTVQLVLKE